MAGSEHKDVLNGLMASLVGIGIHGYSFGFLRHNYTWVLVAILVAIVIQVERQWDY